MPAGLRPQTPRLQGPIRDEVALAKVAVLINAFVDPENQIAFASELGPRAVAIAQATEASPCDVDILIDDHLTDIEEEVLAIQAAFQPDVVRRRIRVRDGARIARVVRGHCYKEALSL